MVYKRFLLSTIVFLVASTAITANDDVKKAKASLAEATVFFNGAELTHNASSTVVKGVNDIWITDLSPNIDVNSLRIKTTKGVIVASYEYSIDFINKKGISPTEKILNDSVKYYKKQIKGYSISWKTNENLIALLDKNQSIGGSQTGLNVAELSKMVEYYGSESNKLNQAQSNLQEMTEKAEEALKRIELQLAQESAKNIKTSGLLKLSITSPLSTSTEFTVTYYTPNANWIPYYDINVMGGSNQIQIASKAKVAQTTGLNWSRIKLSLSTATPSSNKEAPLFSAWFLDFNSLANSAMRNRSSALGKMAQNSYSYADSKDMMVVPTGYGSVRQTPLATYSINGMSASQEEFDSIDPAMIASTNKGKDGTIIVTTKALTDFVDRTDGELNAVYNIDLPYTIEGNGKAQSIDLQNNTVAANITYYAVPELAPEVFVLAEISDWQKLGLLSGKANLTYDETYVGETVINASSTASKLNLTLGTDKRVTVKREKLQDFSSRKFLGKDTQQDIAYKISVKNNQNRSIKMVVKDQYPLTNQKEIQVELLKETTEPTYNNEEVGVLSWEFELGAGASREFKTAYRVKYPKDKDINL